ncbi:MAG: putative transposase [Bacillota bacterium]
MADVLFDITERPEVIKINRAVWIETVNEVRSIYVNYALFTQYPVSDEISERYAMVNLVRSQVVSQRKLAEAFGCHYNTINRYIQAYDENRLEGLVRKTPGPKGPTNPWKITPPIREFIGELAAKEPELTQQAIAKRIEEKFQVTIHRAGVGRALSAYRQQQRQNQPESIQLSIEKDSLAPVVTENDGAPTLPMEPEETELPLTDSVLSTEEDELLMSSCSAQPDDALISRLSQGMDSRYGAALILNPFLQKLELIPILVQSVLAQKDACADKARTAAGNLQELLNPERLYNLAQMFLALVYLIVFRFPSIEAFKLADRKAFGPLIGAWKAPVVKTLRRFLEGVTVLEASGTVAMKLARQYLKLDIVQLGILYLDGHFVPYYGKSQIAKGYFTTRRLALKGNHHYFANDPKGRPIFFRLTSAAVKFTDIIPDMVKDAQELMAETGIKSPLIVVFDRGGYDSKLFQTLDRMGVLYITWRKWDQPIPHELFTHVIYDENGKEGEEPQIKYHAYRRNIRVGQEKYGAEAISFFAPGEEDHSTLVTNAFKFTVETHSGFDPLTTAQIIHDLINRWKQENFFKAAKQGYHIDYNPAYGVHELAEQPLVKNPRIREFDTQISSLKKKLQQNQQLIADKFLNSRTNDKPLSHYQTLKSYQKLIEQKGFLEEEIKTLTAKKDVEPTHIPYQEAKPGQERVALTLERKYLLDNIKIATYNLNEMLLDVFAGCYDDPKDIRQILQMIIERGAHLRLANGTLQVTIQSMDLPKYQMAAEKLCRKLNELEPVTLDKNQFPIFYRVASKE